MPRELEHRAAFESQGETAVRVLAQQGGPIGAEATAWLAEQKALRDDASSAKRDAREKETLEIAKAAAASASDANTIARSNSRRIWRSEIIAAIAAIAAIVAAYAAIKGIK
jgi:siderophore synthetase component